MQFFKNMTIRGKIISVLLFVVFLELAVVICGVYFLNAVNSRLSKIVEVDAEKMKLAASINIDMLEIHRSQKNLLLSTTRELVDKHVRNNDRYRSEIQGHLAGMAGLVAEKERDLLQQFKSRMEDFLRIDNEIESLVLSNWGVSSGSYDEISPMEAASFNVAAADLSMGRGRAAYDNAAQTMSEISNRTSASLEANKQLGRSYFHLALSVNFALSAFSIIVGLLVGIWAARFISGNLNAVVAVTDAIAKGKLETPIEVDAGDETGNLAASVRQMQAALIEARDEAAARDWLRTGVARINDAMRGKIDASDLCTHLISEMATYLEAEVGAVFLMNGWGREPVLELAGGYAYMNNGFPDRFKAGEGLIGQAALEKRQIVAKYVPNDHIKVCSGLGESCPTSIVITPFLFEGSVKGIAELGFLKAPTDLQIEYLEQIMSAVAINIETVQGREKLAKALARSQALTEELQQQQEELKAANEELEEQTQLLKQSEQRLKEQQEELETANQELELNNERLERQKETIEHANRELEQTQIEIEEKAEQLAIASRYKSEFLANMSHELRTPLNSMLLLAGLLAENREGNLNEDQIQSAEIIYSSGNDLLSLINEILDLARIEAGRMEIHPEQTPVRDVAEALLYGFKRFVEEKGLYLTVAVGDSCPNDLWTDRKRLEQILRNLVSNAVKFTEKGGVDIHFDCPEVGVVLPGGMDRENAIAISIRDTGPGIPLDKQRIVFEAFQQLEGGTSRKYGGAGLGLSISKEIAHLLGGEIRLNSDVGKGSTFTLYLPLRNLPASQEPLELKAADIARKPEPDRPDGKGSHPQYRSSPTMPVSDDRAELSPEDKVILIIEDDRNFAELLRRQCREKGFKCLLALTGEEGLALAQEYLPKGVILDLRLPGKDGWTVLEEIKESPRTRHIPVHIMSVEDPSMEAFSKGAIGFLAKPAKREEIEEALRKIEHMFSRRVKELLVVEDDDRLRKTVIKLIGNGDVHADEAASAEEAIRAVKSKRYDCMILDLGLPDMHGIAMLKVLEANETVAMPPVIVYTGRELTREEETELQNYSESIIIKGVQSEERLLDETSLFLHRVVDRMPAMKRQIITNLHDADVMLRGRQVLIVDDDMRNVFALSRIMTEKGVKTLKAENGRKAIELLEDHPDVDLVLMDIMMPVMDGYETMRRIRAQERFRKLPIIALTAKAMRRDRERCLAAGASDYLSKPVDVKRLFSMMRVWLYK